MLSMCLSPLYEFVVRNETIPWSQLRVGGLSLFTVASVHLAQASSVCRDGRCTESRRGDGGRCHSEEEEKDGWDCRGVSNRTKMV